jgi:hypothetical protein
MFSQTVAGPLGEVRAASTAGGGTALTTAALTIPLPLGARHIMIEGRNYSTAVVAKIAINPWLIILKSADTLATVTDYSVAAQDADATTDVVASSLDTLANGDALYIGSHLPFRGIAVDIDAANGTASVLAGHYRKSDNTWAALTVTDNTASGAATLAQDGTITWTMPTDWQLDTLLAAGAAATVNHSGSRLYWVRLSVSAALDSSTTANSMRALNRSTAYMEIVSGRAIEQAVTVGPGGISCVEALTDAGTANLIINCASVGGAGKNGFS